MDNDRALLEAAARAAGIEVHFVKTVTSDYRGDLGYLPYTLKAHAPKDWRKRHGDWCVLWNPLTDDGDALRLAVKLGLVLNLSPREDCRGQTVVTYHGLCKIEESCDEGREVAARRAIVRAAAAMAKE